MLYGPCLKDTAPLALFYPLMFLCEQVSSSVFIMSREWKQVFISWPMTDYDSSVKQLEITGVIRDNKELKQTEK